MKISKVKRANIKKSQKKGPGKKKKNAQKNLAKTNLDTSALTRNSSRRDSDNEFDIPLPKSGGSYKDRDADDLQEYHTDIPLYGYKDTSNNTNDPNSPENSVLKQDAELYEKLRISAEDYVEPEPEEKEKKVTDDGENVKEDPESTPETHAEKIQRQKAERLAAKKSAEIEKKDKIIKTSLLSIKVDNKVIKQYKEEKKILECEASESLTENTSDAEEVKRILPTVTRADLMKEQQRKIQKHREFIGSAGRSIMENPQDRMNKLLQMIECVNIKDPLIRVRIPKLAAKSCLKVFLHIFPNYRLGSLTQQPGKKMKRDTQDIAKYEGELLNRYKYYLKSLERLLENGKENKFKEKYHVELGCTALKCLCELLRRKPVFNYSDDLIELLVPYMTDRLPEFRAIATETFVGIFEEDDTMQFSERIVKAVRMLVKQQQYLVHEDLFRSLLSLKLEHSTSLDVQSENKITAAREKLATKNNLIKMKSLTTSQLNVKERKKQRKITILNNKHKAKTDALEKAKETSIQTRILEMVFTLCVHVIKNDVNRNLLSVVLEGLAKFGHLVNVEYFTSLITNLDTVTKRQKLSVHETIHCVQTVFKMLRGLGSTVVSDLSHFTVKLYAVMAKIDPADPVQVTALEPGLRAVLSIFVGCKTKVTPLHCVGFVKMLSTLAMQCEPKYCIPLLLTMRTLMLTHEGCTVLLDPSSDGSPGPYRPHIAHPALCNPQAACLWEMRHLAETSPNVLVRQISQNVAEGLKLVGDGSIPASITKLSVEEVFKKFVYSKAEPVFNGEDLAGQTRNKAERRLMMARIAAGDNPSPSGCKRPAAEEICPPLAKKRKTLEKQTYTKESIQEPTTSVSQNTKKKTKSQMKHHRERQ